MATVPGVRAASRRLIGRGQELDALVTFGSSLPSGRVSCAVVSGRAGIGKSRLLDEAIEQLAAAETVQVIRGGCVPLDGGPPYAALLSAFRSSGAPALAPAIEVLAGRTPMSRAGLFEAVWSALCQVSTRSSTLVVVEDLHWSDRALRDLLVYLATQPCDGRLGLIVTYRHEGPLSRAELAEFAELLERRPMLRLALDVLSRDEVGEHVASITGVPPAGEVVDDVHRRSGGIPLLVEELVATGSGRVPDHLRALFLARVSALGPGVRGVIDVVAVAGEADDELVARVLDRGHGEVRDALARAEGADLVVADARSYRVRHDLLREVITDDLAPALRRDLHARVAAVLAEDPTIDAASLAHHWYHARRPADAARAAVVAAADAERLHAPASAHAQLERLLELWPQLDGEVRGLAGGRSALLRRAAAAAERAGAFDRAVALTADRLGDMSLGRAERAMALERLGRYRWQAGDGPGASEAYERAVALVADGPEGDAAADVRAKVLSGQAWFFGASLDLERAKARSEEARLAAPDEMAPSTRWQVLLSWGVARLGDRDGHRALEEARDVATRLDDGHHLAVSLLWLNNSLQVCGTTDERQSTLDALFDVAAVYGLGRGVEAAGRFMLAELGLETGRWDDAHALLDPSRHGEAGGMSAYFASGFRARLAAFRGEDRDLAAALEATSRLAAAAPQQPIPQGVALLAESERLLWAKQPLDAHAVARDAQQLLAGDRFYRLESLAVVAWATADVAWEARRRGDPQPAGGPDDLLAALAQADDVTTNRARALTATVEAEIGRGLGHRDPKPWRRAVAAWSETTDSFRLACAQLRLAWALLGSRSGRREAIGALRAASDAAVALNARPLQLAVQSTAAAARIPLTTGASGRQSVADTGLTLREREVLELVAAGRTNAEIAAVLIISARTVGVHVSQILRKLGAARRTEAVDVARRLGVLDP